MYNSYIKEVKITEQDLENKWTNLLILRDSDMKITSDYFKTVKEATVYYYVELVFQVFWGIFICVSNLLYFIKEAIFWKFFYKFNNSSNIIVSNQQI